LVTEGETPQPSKLGVKAMRRKLMSMSMIVGTAAVIIAVPMSLATFHRLATPASRGTPGPTQTTSNSPNVERVMAIGGSVAYGWRAKNNDGYLQQAFAALSANTKTSYEYYNQAIPGADGTQLATMYKGRYEQWLTTIKPQIVVISWGLLNDAFTKVTDKAFVMHLHQEILQALARGATVLVITPPVTRASYTEFKVQEPRYVHCEETLVMRMHDPNVLMFNLYGQMKAYLAAQHQTYVPYMANGWHPNTAGDTLAGKLLYQDFVKAFGTSPNTPS
jgi:acyl-CoA thioesterase-1